MSSESFTIHVLDGNPVGFTTRLVELFENRGPDSAMRGNWWLGRLTTYTKDSPNRTTPRRVIDSDQDYGRSAVSRYEGTRSVNDVSKVDLSEEELLNKAPTKLALHERVGGNLADVTSPALVTIPSDRELEKPLGERYRERVGARAGVVAPTVRLVLRLVLHGDIGRVTHHDVVGGTTEQVAGANESVDVLGDVGVCFRRREQVILDSRGTTPVEERVPDRDVDRELGSVVQPPHPRCLQSGVQETEPGDGHRERILVAAVHRAQAAPNQLPAVGSRLGGAPLLQYSMKDPEEEVTGTAGWVDGTQPVEPELLDGGFQGEVEDELLHELGRL